MNVLTVFLFVAVLLGVFAKDDLKLQKEDKLVNRRKFQYAANDSAFELKPAKMIQKPRSRVRVNDDNLQKNRRPRSVNQQDIPYITMERSRNRI